MGFRVREKAVAAVGLAVAAGLLLMGTADLVKAVRIDRPVRQSAVPVVPLDMEGLPSGDCWYEVGQRDNDGEPGGSKTVKVELLCP